MFSHLKRRFGVLAAVAVMAALVPVLSTSSASAAPMLVAAKGADPATYSACPTNASVPSAGFTDTTSTDVDCIAYYGITTGVTATTYEPSANIPRWQMALYLTRTASKAGHTLGSGADQGFTDISGYAADIQTAINQLKQLGVTTGTTATTYSPDDNVTREQMSMFLDRLLGITTAGPGGVATNAANPLKVDRAAADLYNYTDIDGGGVSFEGHNSIEELYNLRVYGHDETVTTFSPAASMTRADMATWVTNALAHTNVRPAGINIQVSLASGFANNSPTMHISYRTDAHVPVSGQVIDMFQWRSSVTPGNTTAFLADGTCALNSNVSIVGNSLTKCTIDVGDPSTNALGNLSVGTVTVTNTLTENVYAWTAASGTKYDNDVHTSTTVSTTSAGNAANVLVTCTGVDATAQASTTGGATLANAVAVHHGDSITINMQMATSANGGITYLAVPQALNKLTVTHTIYQAGQNAANKIASVASTTLYTDAAGAASYTFTQADPNLLGTAAAATDDVLHTILVGDGLTSASAEIQGAQGVTGGIALTNVCVGYANNVNVESVPMSFDFRDETSDEAVTATLTLNSSSYKAGTATAPISRSATLSCTDKYGDAYAAAADGCATVTFHGGGHDALLVDANLAALVGANGTANVLDLDATTSVAGTFAVGDGVCFVALAGGITTIGGVAPVVGTEYAVQALGIADGAGTTAGTGLVLGTVAAPTVALVLVGASAVGDVITAAHKTMGCAVRSVGPAGTASVAWNETVATSGRDQVGATTMTDTVIADNADGVSTITEKTKTAFRWVAPSTTVLSGNTAQHSQSWATVDDNNDNDPDQNLDVTGNILEHDAVNGTIVAELAFDDDTAPIGNGAIGDQLIVSYSYDSGDYFFLNSSLGVSTTPTTLAGFVGAYTTGTAGFKGILNGMAANGTTWTEGSLDAVTYQAAAASTSIFKLGLG